VATKKDRQRKLARERYERRQAREAQRQARTRQLTKWVSAGVVVVVIAAIVTLTALHLTRSSAAPSTSPSASPSASTSPSLSPSASPSPASSPTPNAAGLVRCSYVPGGHAARHVGLPPHMASVKGKYQATITTNRGTIVVDLLNAKAPCTVNSFTYLAGQKYFSNTPCHRLTTSNIYVLQCGDPTGTGTGGPGYQFASENLSGATYPAGTVAMANSGSPDTNGSQFFLVYKDMTLPPSYTPFGTIVNGLSVIQAIAKAGTDNANGPGDGHPKEKVTIESITIKKT
jgi:peptidyl-prolyl cis-trans isomerase B (cyclophilin B)